MIEFKNSKFHSKNPNEAPVLIASLKRVANGDFPIFISTQIKKIYKKIEKSYEVYWGSYVELVKKYAYKNEDDKYTDKEGKLLQNDQYILDQNQKDKFEEELEMLLDVDVKIFEEPIYFSKIPDKFKDELRIKPVDLDILDFLFKE